MRDWRQLVRAVKGSCLKGAGTQPHHAVATVLLSAIIIVALVAENAQAKTVCTAADVTAQDAGCPSGSGGCSVTKVLQVGDGCTLDFGAREVTITGTLDINSGVVTIVAASLTIAPGGLIDGRGNQATPAGSAGGMISIQVSGSVSIEKTGSTAGRIDVSGLTNAGTIAINADGSVSVAGKLNADQLGRMGDGGNIRITAGTDIVSALNSVISATGGDQAGGGEVDLTAGSKVMLGDAVSVAGGCGGTVNVSAGDTMTMQAVNNTATGDGGVGGCVDLTAGTAAQLLDKVDTSGSPSSTSAGAGSGGAVCIEAQFGNLTVARSLLAEGAAPDGGGGEIDLAAQGTITVQPRATISARGNGGQGCGGILSVTPNLGLSSAALLDASGGAAGGEIDICAGTDATLSGGLDVSGRSTGSSGGQANVDAGVNGPGTLLVQSAIDASGGACDATNGCGQGGCTALSACDLTVTPAGSVLAAAPQAGANDLMAREQLTILGKVNAAKTTSSGIDGTNTLEFPSRKSPIVSSPVTPPAAMTAWDTCTATATSDCLMPCPVCGDGVVEFPETCDNNVGTPLGCDGCSALCQLENCDDGSVCTLDSCDPLLGCLHVPAPSPCTELPTPTLTITPTPSPAPTRTETGTPVATMIPTATGTPTANPTATLEPTPTARPGFPPSTPSPTPTLLGDANCDDEVTAADLTDLVTLIVAGRPDACGGRAVNSADVSVTIDAIFAP
jgi:hypothetical protein